MEANNNHEKKIDNQNCPESEKEEVKTVNESEEKVDEQSENNVDLDVNQNDEANNDNQLKDKKTKFWFSDKKLKDELAETNKKLEELQDKYMRQVAEYSNFKKRTAKEKLELRDSVKSSILLDFIPVIDDIDRAMSHLSSIKDVDATIEGIKLIHQKFLDFIKSQNLEEIDALDHDFNTDYHEAVTQIHVDDESKKGKVIEVIQKGYKINDKVVRYSKVIVAE